jgi:hypothetical protein
VRGIKFLVSHNMEVHQPNMNHSGKILNSSTDWLTD